MNATRETTIAACDVCQVEREVRLNHAGILCCVDMHACADDWSRLKNAHHVHRCRCGQEWPIPSSANPQVRGGAQRKPDARDSGRAIAPWSERDNGSTGASS